MKLPVSLFLLGILPVLFVSQSKEGVVGIGPSFKGPVKVTPRYSTCCPQIVESQMINLPLVRNP